MEVLYTTGPNAYARAFTEFFGYKYVKKYPPNDLDEDFYMHNIL